jgi:3-phosphoshikimate 1-carboxyvinyltransferase
VSLPQKIEIVPLAAPVNAQIAVPGSKSITNRALVVAALSPAATILRGALWSDDTEVMVQCLQKLGVSIAVTSDPDESANRTIRVDGRGGSLGSGGPASHPLELFVGNAGTSARFLAALVCLGEGSYRLSGTERMHERPQAALFSALRGLGYSVHSANDRLPAVIVGSGPHPGARCRVQVEESSQFASALLLCADRGGWQVSVQGESAEESPYIQLTSEVIGLFPKSGGTFDIEPDASSASYFWGADWLLRGRDATRGSRITVLGAGPSSAQVDARFPRVIEAFPDSISRITGLGDSIMTAIVLAPFAASAKSFTDLGRLRVQECERVFALKTELRKCGALVTEEGDSLHVTPGPLHGSEIETYDDHRMAMCFAMLGLAVPGIVVRNPECVRKTFPGFFEKLKQPPPRGLGARLQDEPA